MSNMIKLSAVFKVKDGEDTMLLEVAMRYDTVKASESKLSKFELYESLKAIAVHQVKQVSEEAEVFDATADEVKEHYETQN